MKRWLFNYLMVVVLATAGSAKGEPSAAGRLVVDARADQNLSSGVPVALKATVTNARPGPVRMFWTKVSGPGTAVFSHESFNASFEDGTIGEWTAPSEYGYPGGNQAGGGYVSKEQAHSGVHSWKAYNDPKLAPPENYSAKLVRWRFDYAEAYYSAWYYWPTDYLVDDGTPRSVNILQFKERTKPSPPTWTVNVKSSKSHPGVDHLNLYDCQGHAAHNAPGGLPVPKGRWFHLAVYQKAGRTDGELAVWLDGARVFNLKRVNTLGSANNTNPPFLEWGVGNYGPAGIDKFIYVDDTVVTNAANDPRDTSVRFSAPGEYVLRFTASDDEATASREIRVTAK